MEKQKTLTEADLKQFTGDLERYRHPFNRMVIYTPGVRYLAEQGEAYWLIDLISSYFGSELMNEAIIDDIRLETLQFWRIEVAKGGQARLTCRADEGERPSIVHDIDHTDFPLESVDIWASFDGRHWTLYLPSEH